MRFTDQTGFTSTLKARPVRIVSLVPSITELLHDLDLEKEVVGITRFCVRPDSWFKSKTRVGGTKDPDIERIKALQPDLIIANKEENRAEDVFVLRESCLVWVSDVNDLESALEMILDLGKLTDRAVKAQSLKSEISQGFKELEQYIKKRRTVPYKTLYFIWKNPWMVAGSDTFINDMMRKCGWINSEQKTRYPEWEFKTTDPSPIDFILLSSEPYPFRERHREELQGIFPKARILLVDGESFSWYGSRLRHSPAYFRDLIRPL